MDKYVCDVCGYVYDPAVGDPDNGIDPGTSFDQLPEDWVCPLWAWARICSLRNKQRPLTSMGLKGLWRFPFKGACFRRYRWLCQAVKRLYSEGSGFFAAETLQKI